MYSVNRFFRYSFTSSSLLRLYPAMLPVNLCSVRTTLVEHYRLSAFILLRDTGESRRPGEPIRKQTAAVVIVVPAATAVWRNILRSTHSPDCKFQRFEFARAFLPVLRVRSARRGWLPLYTYIYVCNGKIARAQVTRVGEEVV